MPEGGHRENSILKVTVVDSEVYGKGVEHVTGPVNTKGKRNSLIPFDPSGKVHVLACHKTRSAVGLQNLARIQCLSTASCKCPHPLGS